MHRIHASRFTAEQFSIGDICINLLSQENIIIAVMSFGRHGVIDHQQLKVFYHGRFEPVIRKESPCHDTIMYSVLISVPEEIT